ncbi:hypothetical protein F5890DRAFT_921626 [Lentinula detonsa]|uniref:Secreted protein n=1 Tax=Lentinula detonsa TaxID=2804962 RepID=A0AA38PQ26_9AGAR|nr:hypothetical protein F5890DRAFT_921626 [Lentinula detonsa]
MFIAFMMALVILTFFSFSFSKNKSADGLEKYRHQNWTVSFDTFSLASTWIFRLDEVPPYCDITPGLQDADSEASQIHTDTAIFKNCHRHRTLRPRIIYFQLSISLPRITPAYWRIYAPTNSYSCGI